MSIQVTIHPLHLPLRLEQEVHSWMHVPVITVHRAAPLSEALVLMHQHNIRRLLVVDDGGDLCGMITGGDIRGANVLSADGVDVHAIADALCRIKVDQVMSRQLVTITPDTGMREAAMLMIEHKIGGLPIVDGNHVVVGIITESDLFEVLVQQLGQQNQAA